MKWVARTSGMNHMRNTILSQHRRAIAFALFLFSPMGCLVSLWGCTGTENSSYSTQQFPLKQNHGSTDALTEAYLSQFPNLEDNIPTGEPPKTVVDWETTVAENPRYSSIHLSSVASPSIFFGDISACGPTDSPYPSNYIYREDPGTPTSLEPEYVCYKSPDCSASMVSPNVLMTAGHCECIGFGHARNTGMPIAETPDGAEAASALFRSYTTLGIPASTDYYYTHSHPWYYSDETFLCEPIYSGWSGFFYRTDGRPYCFNREFDIAFFWCHENEEGVAPGDKYGFTDYHVDFFHELEIGHKNIRSTGYPLPPPSPEDKYWAIPRITEIIFYSIWQNPIYRGNYWNKENTDPAYSYASPTWNSDNAWPVCNYVYQNALCDANVSTPYNIWTDTGGTFPLNDYILFYGHKLLSEGTVYAINKEAYVSPNYYNYDHFMIYKTHGGSGAPVFSLDGKLVAGPTLSAGDFAAYDYNNRGFEDEYDPIQHSGDPITRTDNYNFQWALYDSPHAFDADMNFIIDFIEGTDSTISYAYKNDIVSERGTYYLPFHEWHVRRSIWDSYNYGSLLWDGHKKPLRYTIPPRTMIPFGVVRSFEKGRWIIYRDPLTGRPVRDYIPPAEETNLQTNAFPLQDVNLKPDTQYGIVVKYINTEYPTSHIVDYHKTLLKFQGIPHPLPNPDLFQPYYHTIFVQTDSSGYYPVEFSRQGYGQTLVEDVLIQETEIVSSFRRKITYTFDSWDERAIWATYDYPTITAEWKQSMFWNVERDDVIGMAGVLLGTDVPLYDNNLSTFYTPLEPNHDYQVCADFTSTRVGPPDETEVNNTSVRIDILDANDVTVGASYAIIDEWNVGYLQETYPSPAETRYSYYWTTNQCVHLHTHDIDASSYYILLRRVMPAQPHVLVDNLTIEEMPES